MENLNIKMYVLKKDLNGNDVELSHEEKNLISNSILSNEQIFKDKMKMRIQIFDKSKNEDENEEETEELESEDDNEEETEENDDRKSFAVRIPINEYIDLLEENSSLKSYYIKQLENIISEQD
eukprot:gene11568-4814_t